MVSSMYDALALFCHCPAAHSAFGSLIPHPHDALAPDELPTSNCPKYKISKITKPNYELRTTVFAMVGNAIGPVLAYNFFPNPMGLLYLFSESRSIDAVNHLVNGVNRNQSFSDGPRRKNFRR